MIIKFGREINSRLYVLEKCDYVLDGRHLVFFIVLVLFEGIFELHIVPSLCIFRQEVASFGKLILRQRKVEMSCCHESQC